MLKVTLVLMAIVNGVWTPTIKPPEEFPSMQACMDAANKAIVKAPNDRVYGAACTIVKTPADPV